LAHPGKRFQAQFVDELVVLTSGYLAFYLTDILVARDIAVYVGFFVGTIYFLFSDGMHQGQSIGKKVLNLRVVNLHTRQSCTFLESFLRNITFPLGLIDWAFIFFGKHRRLGDFLASTIVIKSENRIDRFRL
jgi:uncharacterized RDD family membrane protein YckC